MAMTPATSMTASICMARRRASTTVITPSAAMTVAATTITLIELPVAGNGH
jgi:hypothetical protein